MYLLYNLLIIIILCLYSPVILFKIIKGQRDEWPERLGLLNKDLLANFINKKTIWLHAASVGEALVSKQLLEELKKDYPDYSIVLSTITLTGREIARESIKNVEAIILLPVDISFIIKKVIKLFNPQILILIETELWPNLIREAHRQKTKVMLASGRIGDRSFKNYQYLRLFLKKILLMIDFFCMQSELDAERIIALGAPKNKVLVTGNVKYDRQLNYLDPKEIIDKLKITTDRPVLVAGSTHHNEEEQLLEVYCKLKKEFPELLLIIAPRYIERVEEIQKIFVNQGISTVKWSGIKGELAEQTVVLLDTIGELAGFYQVATVVFVGGSLIPRGGHNILEPAAYGKAILVGPFMFNFKEELNYFLSGKALIQIDNAKGLADQLTYYLNHQTELREIGRRAKKLIESNKGALPKNLAQIKFLLRDRLKILLVRLSAIGDIIHALPVVWSLRNRYPTAEISWLVEDKFAELVSLNPYLDKIIIMPRQRWTKTAQSSKWAAFRLIWRFFKELKSAQFDLVIDLHGILKSALPVGMTRAAARYGRADAREGSTFFYNHKIKIPLEIKHKIERHLYLAEQALGFEYGKIEFGLKTGPVERAKITHLLIEQGVEEKGFVVINPYTNWKTKNWLMERYQELAARLVKELNYQVIFTGASGERAGIEQIIDQSGQGVFNFAGLVNLRELAELYQRAKLYIGGDTGPMHMAVAVNIPVIAIMGPTNPLEFGPYGAEHIVLQDQNLSCINCWKRDCPYQLECMSNITTEQVLKSAQHLLGVKQYEPFV